MKEKDLSFKILENISNEYEKVHVWGGGKCVQILTKSGEIFNLRVVLLKEKIFISKHLKNS